MGVFHSAIDAYDASLPSATTQLGEKGITRSSFLQNVARATSHQREKPQSAGKRWVHVGRDEACVRG